MPEAKQLQDYPYHIKCKVEIKRVAFMDHQSEGDCGMVEEDMVFLVPQEGDQRTAFYNAWLPDTLDQFFEIGMSMGHPIFGVFRGAVARVHAGIKEPHIFVMTKSAEEVFKNVKGKTIDVKVLAQGDEILLDQAADYDLKDKKTFDKVGDSVTNN